MVSIQLITLTSNGEEGLRKYIAEVEEYARLHPIKTKMVEKMKKTTAGTTEEYFENPLRLVITLSNDSRFLENKVYYLQQIEVKLNAIMKRYNVSKEDYVIEVL